MTSLAVEMTASRLLGPAFGVSNLVWACIIGLILIYLTAGYFIGGRWADRSPYPRTMYSLLAWAAFISGLVPLAARPVIRFAADAFDQLQVAALFGSFTAVLILFSVPVTLLGMISPFAIRLAITDPQEAGRISGRIYAISTLGSFLGTFLPVLVLTPLIGTTLTFIAFSLFLNLIALVGIWEAGGWKIVARWAWMPVVILFLTAFLGRGPIKDTQGQIYEGESAYNYIQVLQVNNYRYLRLNEGQGIHSEWNPTELIYNGPWEEFLAAPFFNNPPFHMSQVKNMAIVGLAAGTVARQATAVYGPIPIDGYEIDPKIIEVGRKYFDMTEPNLNAIAQDGRYGLEHNQTRYSIIAVDAYRPPYIPWHLTTVEFFSMTRQHLTPDGVLAINVGRSPKDRSLVDDLASTLQAVFPSVYVVDLPYSYNSLIYATNQPTKAENLYQNAIQIVSQGEANSLVIHSLEVAYSGLKPAPPEKIVFTDDWAPIELITNQMVMKFMLFGNMNDLQAR